MTARCFSSNQFHSKLTWFRNFSKVGFSRLWKFRDHWGNCKIDITEIPFENQLKIEDVFFILIAKLSTVVVGELNFANMVFVRNVRLRIGRVHFANLGFLNSIGQNLQKCLFD